MLLQVSARRAWSPSGSAVLSWDMQAFVLPAEEAHICKVCRWLGIGSPAPSTFMSVLFMSAPCCSLPASSQVKSFFHMEILPSLQIHFQPCQAPGAGAGFSQRSGPLDGSSKCPLVTWGV